MLTILSTANMMTVPTVNYLKAAPAGDDGALAFLMGADETVLYRFVAEHGGESVHVSERRIVWLDQRGGMMGKRLETYSLRLAHIVTVSTMGAGGLTGEAEVKLGVSGVGDITLGFHKDTDISGLIGHLTRHAGLT